jgi:hypothetical protein
MSAPEPVRVTCWGELRGEEKIPGALRVLVGGQAAGGVRRDGAVWRAGHQVRALSRWSWTEHASAEEAVARVLRSGFARRLGARAASRVYWSDKARRAAARGGAR